MRATYHGYRASGNHATYNGIGSKKRNGPKGGTYGFLADMRLRLNQKFRAYFYRKMGGRKAVRALSDSRHSMLILAYSHAWRSRNRQYDVTYYGRAFILNVVDPYCVITCADTHEVAGVMPLATDKRLRNLYS